MSKKEIEKVLSLQSKKINDNVKIINNNDIGMNYILRLDDNLMTRKLFIPRIAISQAGIEDRTLPRVVGSPYLLGCVVAMPWINPLGSSGTNIHVGFYLHYLEFDYCLQPNNKLVFDSSETNELWLITYNKNTIDYKAKRGGEVIVANYTITPSNTKTYQRCLMELYVHITKDDGIYFNKEIKLKKGYHSVKFYLNETKSKYNETTLEHKEEIKVKAIPEEEFDKCKKTQTSLEHIDLFNKPVPDQNKLTQW